MEKKTFDPIFFICVALILISGATALLGAKRYTPAPEAAQRTRLVTLALANLQNH